MPATDRAESVCPISIRIDPVNGFRKFGESKTDQPIRRNLSIAGTRFADGKLPFADEPCQREEQVEV